MPVTLRQLRYFKAVVEHGSFSRAAESVYVSQPALSLQIRELEDTLGSPLLERESRGVVLTPLGREVHGQTLRVLDEALLLETIGKRFAEGPFRIAVGVVSTLAPYLLAGLLEHLQGATPRIELDILEAPGQDLVTSLLAGRLDAAILSLPLGLLELTERELFEDRFVLAGRSERLAAFRALGDSAEASDLAQSDIGPLLALGEGHCLGDQVLGACSMWRPQDVHRGAASLATLAALVAERRRPDPRAGDGSASASGRRRPSSAFSGSPRRSLRGGSVSFTARCFRVSPGSTCWPRPRQGRAQRSWRRRGRQSATSSHRPDAMAQAPASVFGQGRMDSRPRGNPFVFSLVLPPEPVNRSRLRAAAGCARTRRCDRMAA